MKIELEEMSEEQLRELQDFIKSSIAELENERDWRDSEGTDLIPYLHGLSRYISREMLNEEVEAIDELKFNHAEEEEDDFDF